MSTQLVLSTVGCLLAAATLLAEDAPYAECRYLRAAGQVQITMGFMDRTADLDSRKAALERNGILVLETSTPRTFTRTDRAGGHDLVTTISLQPPVGHGEGGASSFTDIRILLDGRPLVDAPLSRGWGGIDRMVIDPARRFVTVSGHEGIVRYEGFESKRVVDKDWLAERARTVRELIRK
jgi:hypothetical protein